MENNTLQIYEKIATQIPYSENLFTRTLIAIFLILLIFILSIWLLDMIDKKRHTIQLTIVGSIILSLTVILGINILKPTILNKVFDVQTGYNTIEVTDKNKYELVVTNNKEYLVFDKKGNNLILKYKNGDRSWYTNQTTFKILGETDNAYLVEANMTNYDFLDSETITKQLLIPKK